MSWVRSARRAGALCSASVVACSLLRPLDDLESSASALESACPEEMQRVRFRDGTAFCIDALETSRAEYEEFLDADAEAPPAAPQAAALCAAKESFEPGGGADCQAAYERDVDQQLPVACVDLCDAMAYCGFRGKRLCGGQGGAMINEESVNSPVDDEWFVACTGGTGRLFPYAATFAPGRCNIDSERLEAVDAAPSCETPDHIQQLSGNVAEWVLICKEFPRRGETRCLARGGEYLTVDRSLAGCHQAPGGPDAESPVGVLPTQRAPGIGIRCCRD